MRVKDKSIIVTGSGGGIGEGPGLTWYNAFKEAVITTSKSLAAELGPDNIRVNCIHPVFNPDTGLSAEFAGGRLDEGRKALFRASIPLGRFSTALDVANAALTWPATRPISSAACALKWVARAAFEENVRSFGHHAPL